MVASHTKSQTKPLESEWLGSRRSDRLLRIDTLGETGVADLVDIGDIDHAVAIFEKLRHLGNLWLGDWNNSVEYWRVQILFLEESCCR